ncbi:hypothetical protein [Clostridium sp. UBA1056]|uniref:hypothetical protein n=1 Tax=unclassified Clostridium TaxID=2614128 RepID=UPI00321754D1
MYILLIAIGVTLIALNIKAIRRDEKNFNKAMVEAESNVDEVDMRLVEIRSEFAKTITELQREISDLKRENYEESKDGFKIYDEPINNMSEEKCNNSKDELSEHMDKLNEDNEFIEEESVENIDSLDKSNINTEYINTLIDKIDSLDDDILIQVENKDKLAEKLKEEEKDSNPKKGIKSNSLKVEDVKELLGQGLSEDTIAQRLSIGKGEVLLIKELYLK